MTQDEADNNKMQQLMYALTKHAARVGFREFLEDKGITSEDYILIKKEWKDKLGVVPYV